MTRQDGAGRTVRHALVLVNPRKRANPDLDAALARLGAGMSLIEITLNLSPAGRQLIRSAAREADLMIVAGGDGTVHRAAPLLLEARLPVGLLPAGTANDLARTLGLPADPLAAAEVILTGVPRPIDLGEVNGHPYFNVASIGMSVALARSLGGNAKRRWGRAAYALAAARVALSAKPFRASIIGPEGAIAVESLQIAVGNGRYYGGGLAVEEQAAIDDGHLHLYSLEMAHAWSMIPMLWAFRRGTHGRWASVRTLVGSGFEIRTRRPMAVNADGELVTETPCTFRVLPRALRVLVPAGSGAG